MTDLTLVPPSPAAPPTKPRLNWSHILIASSVAIVAIAVAWVGSLALIQAMSPAPAPPISANADQSFLRADDVPVCAAGLATAWNDARQGTGGQVTAQGPAVVIVDVGYEGRTREVQQQITSHDNMMTWDMPLYAQADSIRISIKTNTSYDTCQIGSPSYPGITRSRSLYGVVR
jgi:hypothetical protein